MWWCVVDMGQCGGVWLTWGSVMVCGGHGAVWWCVVDMNSMGCVISAHVGGSCVVDMGSCVPNVMRLMISPPSIIMVCT